MSTASWMSGGQGKLLLEVPANDPYPPIKVFDIREPNFVGVEYSGDKNDRQAQPRIWWEERLRKADAPPPLPKIQPRARPTVVAATVPKIKPRPRLKIQLRKRS